MKKITILLLCLLVMLCADATASVAVRMEETAALLTRDGETLIAPGAYADIVPLGNGWFAAKTGERYALMDEGGACRTETIYERITAGEDGFLVEAGGAWGILNPDGGILVEPAYAEIHFDGAGGFWTVSEDGLLGRIDANGSCLMTEQRVLRIAEAPTEGLLCVQSAENDRFGFVDADGDFAIEPIFDYAEPFTCGVALITADGGRGAIDTSGAYVLPPVYDTLQISGAGALLAGKRGAGVTAFDGTGNEIARYPGETVSAAAAGDGWVICDGTQVRAFDASGEEILRAGADAAVLPGIGGAWIVSDGAWGEECVRLYGSGAAYQDLFPLGTSGGEAIYGVLTVPTARYMNDLLGEIQLSTDMDSARYGIADAQGNARTDCVYLSLEFLEDDRLLARTETDWQMIDARGNVIWSAPASESATG